jgi:hypothetical protein
LKGLDRFYLLLIVGTYPLLEVAGLAAGDWYRRKVEDGLIHD